MWSTHLTFRASFASGIRREQRLDVHVRPHGRVLGQLLERGLDVVLGEPVVLAALLERALEGVLVVGEHDHLVLDGEPGVVLLALVDVVALALARARVRPS